MSDEMICLKCKGKIFQPNEKDFSEKIVLGENGYRIVTGNANFYQEYTLSSLLQLVHRMSSNGFKEFNTTTWTYL